MHWTRPALETKMDSLEERYSGDEFVQAVAEFADTLEPEDRKTLQDVLLERADERHRDQFPPGLWRKR